MATRANCGCGARLALPDDSVGKWVRCPRCGLASWVRRVDPTSRPGRGTASTMEIPVPPRLGEGTPPRPGKGAERPKLTPVRSRQWAASPVRGRFLQIASEAPTPSRGSNPGDINTDCSEACIDGMIGPRDGRRIPVHEGPGVQSVADAGTYEVDVLDAISPRSDRPSCPALEDIRTYVAIARDRFAAWRRADGLGDGPAWWTSPAGTEVVSGEEFLAGDPRFLDEARGSRLAMSDRMAAGAGLPTPTRSGWRWPNWSSTCPRRRRPPGDEVGSGLTRHGTHLDARQGGIRIREDAQ